MTEEERRVQVRGWEEGQDWGVLKLVLCPRPLPHPHLLPNFFLHFQSLRCSYTTSWPGPRRLFNGIKSTMSRQMAVSLNPAERTGRLLLLRGLLLRLRVSALALLKLSQ